MPAREDTWVFVPIGAPFPDHPIRVKGQQNMYVALWYKHGKPVQGRAWNNGGVVECSFGYNGVELTGFEQLGGFIQVLTYNADDEYDGWPKLGYWYEWVRYKEKNSKPGQLEICHCNTVAPILGRAGNGEMMCGNIDMANDTVTFSYDGKEERITDQRTVNDMWIIVRNLTNPVKPPPPPPKPKIHVDMWVDLKAGSKFPLDPVLANNKMLKMEDGRMQHQYICLWYKHGQPIMGRCWKNAAGKLEATFAWGGHQFSGDVGSMQVLCYPADRMSFKYQWMPLKQAINNYRVGQYWQPMHVKDCAPIITKNYEGDEVLGMVMMSKERASCAWDGKEIVTTGPPVTNMLVLCRHPPLLQDRVPVPVPWSAGPMAIKLSRLPKRLKPDAPPPPKSKIHVDTWMDLKVGSKFPLDPVLANNKMLKMEDGRMLHQYICLWYKHGQPIMGRCWKNAAGKLEATFGWGGHQFSGDVGSVQVLCYPSDRMIFEYQWMPFQQAMNNYRNGHHWQPMHVKDCAAIITRNNEGDEVLGMVLMAKERASCGWGGKEIVTTGPAVANMLVLCHHPPQQHDPSN